MLCVTLWCGRVELVGWSTRTQLCPRGVIRFDLKRLEEEKKRKENAARCRRERERDGFEFRYAQRVQGAQFARRSEGFTRQPVEARRC